MNNLLLDIGVIIIVATVFAYITRLLKQPLITAYVIAGIIIQIQLVQAMDVPGRVTIGEAGVLIK